MGSPLPVEALRAVVRGYKKDKDDESECQFEAFLKENGINHLFL